MFKLSLINLIYKFIDSLGHSAQLAKTKLGMFLYILPLFFMFCSCSLNISPSKPSLDFSIAPLTVDASENGFDQLVNELYKLSPNEQKAQMAAFHAKAGEIILQQKSAYVLARILQKTKTQENYEAAISLYEQASHLSPIWTICHFHIAECAQELGKEKKVRQSLNNIIEHTKDEETRIKAEYYLAQSYLRANEKDKAYDIFLSIKRNYPNSQFALGAEYYIAQANLNSNERVEAIALLRDYLKKSPDGRFALDIVNELTQLPNFTPTAEDHNLFAQAYFAYSNYNAALSEWTKAKNKTHWYEQAICLKQTGKTKEAQNTLSFGIKNYPNDTHIPEAAILLTKMLPQAQSINVYQSIAHQSSRHKDLGLYNLALRAPAAQGFAYFKQIVLQFPNSDYAPESLWRLMWAYCQQNNFKAALTLSEIGQEKYTQAKSAPRFPFWAGKIYEKIGDKTKAINFYKITVHNYGPNYYGHRAKQRLNALTGKHDKGWYINQNRHLSNDYLNWSWPNTQDLVSYSIIKQSEGATIALLFELAQWDECLELLSKNANPLLKSLCLAKLNLPLEAINAATPYLKGEPTIDKKWQMAYPLLYAKYVAQESAHKNVDPYLAQALIREESRYNAQAISSSNARGLMQLLISTAHATAKHVGITLHNTMDIHDPETNIKLGVDYLSYVLKRFNGNALFAVASYNGGPNAVANWSKRFNTRDLDVFVENIPYKETRDYVRKVFGSYWNYEDIYR
jgi:soluble lytic murein transglycosylase